MKARLRRFIDWWTDVFSIDQPPYGPHRRSLEYFLRAYVIWALAIAPSFLNIAAFFFFDIPNEDRIMFFATMSCWIGLLVSLGIITSAQAKRRDALAEMIASELNCIRSELEMVLAEAHERAMLQEAEEALRN